MFTSLRSIPVLIITLAALLATSAVQAANLYWDTNGTGTSGSGAVTGTWGTDAFWTTDSTGANVGSPVLTATTTNADDLFFSAGANGTTGTLTVTGIQSAHSITYSSGQAGFTITGGTIKLGSATAGSGFFFANIAETINSAITLDSAATAVSFNNNGNQTITFGATATITGLATSGTQTITFGGTGGGAMNMGGIISDGAGGGKVALTINSAYTTTLSAANTYTGATNLIAGTLSIGNASTFTNTSAINISSGRLIVNAANASLAKLATSGGGSGVVAGSFLRFSQAQTTAGAGNGPGTIYGTVELNLTNVNPNYTLDFGSGGALTNLVTATYTSPITLSGTASIDSSSAVATYSTGGITASTSGSKTLNLTGTNTGANTISSAIGNGSGTIAVTKGGGGNWILSGTNTYTGNTRVDAGTLQFVNQASLYNNGAAAAWSKNNVNVGSGATMAFNVGGAGQFTKANIITLLGLSDAATNGFNNGSILGLDTTGGNFLYDSVISNANGGANVLGLTKLGTNTLTLDQNNTYTGHTTIAAGTLQLGNGSTTGRLSTGSNILNNGTFTINRSDAVAQGTDFSAASIVGTGAFVQAGSGTTTLNVANTFSGTTTVSGGVLSLTNALALQNSALVTTGAGTVTLSGITTVTLGGLSGASGNLASIITSGYTGSITALTLNPLSGSVTYGGIISDGSGAMTLTKTGAGTQILSGANTYTGKTIVNAGTLTLGSGTAGSLSSSSTLQMGGGIFNYSNTGANQTVNGLIVDVGNSTINNTASGRTLILGAITRTGSIYGTANFSTLTGSISTTTANTNGIIGPWLTTGSTTTLRYAVGSADGVTPTNISALTGTTATAGTLANLTDATGNFEYSAAATTSADLTANTLRYSGAATTTAIGATNTLTLNGLMNAGTGTLTISGGPSSGGILIGSSGELVIAANAQATTISAVIAGSGGRLIYTGAATLTLSGTNTYTGGTFINAGTLAITSDANVGGGLVTINAGGTLSTGNQAYAINMTLNGGTLAIGSNGASGPMSGTITLNANSTISASNTNSGVAKISGSIGGAGGFTKTGNGTLQLNGSSNTYTGPTVVSTGGLIVKSSLYGNTTSNWTPANITVANNANFLMNVGGAGEFTTTQAGTMFSQLSSNINNNGLLAGAIIGVDTRNASAGTYTLSTSITDSSGPGGGAVSFRHTGTTTTILALTGANTYTGTTIVENGSFLQVSSLNSVFTNAALGTVHSASSSLGAPTTVANGIIHLGGAYNAIGNTFQAGGLIYVGTGETTDRMLSLDDGGGGTSTLDQSGTGNLKFISSFTTSDGRGVKTLKLQGSTSGTGEIASSIPDMGGSFQLQKSGTGTWTLSGSNLYLGVTTVNGGALVLAHANALNGGIGATGGLGGLTFNGGVIGLGAGDFSRPLAAAGTAGAVTFTGNGGWAAYGADRVVNLGGASATITWATANTGLNAKTLILGNTTATHTVDFQNPLDMTTAARTVQVDDGAAVIDGKLSGVISGGAGGNLTKTGTGALALSGTNTYTGTTTIQAGALVAGTSSLASTNGAFGNASSAIVLGNGSTAASDAPAILINGAFTVGRNITVGSVANTAAYNATIGGSNTSGTSIYSGNITLNTTAANYAVTLRSATGGTTDFTTGTWTTNNKTINVGSAGNTGIVRLSNTMSTTGAVNVNYGTFQVNGTLGGVGSTVAVASGATLGGTGSINSSVTINSGGTLAAGNSIESLASGNLTLAAAAIFAYEMNNDALAGVAGDLTAVTGNLTLDAGNASILTLSELGSGSWTAGESLTLISYSGTWNGGLFTYSSTVINDGDTISFSGMNWLVDYNDTTAGDNYTGDLTGTNFVTMTAIPEPGVALLGGLSLLGLFLRRRRD